MMANVGWGFEKAVLRRWGGVGCAWRGWVGEVGGTCLHGVVMDCLRGLCSVVEEWGQYDV